MVEIMTAFDKKIAVTYSGLEYKNMLFEVGPTISTGSESLDSLLDHGIEPLKLYMFYGPAGSGKTIILHQIAVNAVSTGYKVLYLDCEKSFSPGLITKIAGRFNVQEDIDKILYKRIKYPGEFEFLFNKLSNQDGINVILIDNFDRFIKLYASELHPDPGFLHALTRQLLLRFHYLKEVLKIPIVITNRVYSNIDDVVADSYLPYGGVALRSMINKSIHLMKEGGFIRAIDIYSNNPSSMLTIKNDGVYDL